MENFGKTTPLFVLFWFFSFFSSKINTLIAKKGFEQLQKPILLVAVLPQRPFPLNSSSPYGMLQDEQIPRTKSTALRIHL